MSSPSLQKSCVGRPITLVTQSGFGYSWLMKNTAISAYDAKVNAFAKSVNTHMRLTGETFEAAVEHATKMAAGDMDTAQIADGTKAAQRLQRTLETGREYSHEFEIRANFGQASDPIQYRLNGEKRWCGTPFQVADTRHSERTAYEMVDGWLDSQA